MFTTQDSHQWSTACRFNIRYRLHVGFIDFPTQASHNIGCPLYVGFLHMLVSFIFQFCATNSNPNQGFMNYFKYFYNLINREIPEEDWINLQFSIQNDRRNTRITFLQMRVKMSIESIQIDHEWDREGMDRFNERCL